MIVKLYELVDSKGDAYGPVFRGRKQAYEYLNRIMRNSITAVPPFHTVEFEAVVQPGIGIAEPFVSDVLVYRVRIASRKPYPFLGENKPWEFPTREAAIQEMARLDMGGVSGVNEKITSGFYEIVPIPAGTELQPPVTKSKSRLVKSEVEVLGPMPIKPLMLSRQLQAALVREFDEKWVDYQEGGVQ